MGYLLSSYAQFISPVTAFWVFHAQKAFVVSEGDKKK